MILGVYGDAIGIYKLPMTIPVAFWTIVEVLQVGEKTECVFRVVHGPNETELVRARGDVNVTKIAKSAFPIPRLMLNIEEEGQLKLQYLNSEEVWESVAEINVFHDTTSSSDSQPPF